MRRPWIVIALVAMASAGVLAFAGPAAARKGPPEFFGIVPQGNVPTNADFRRMGRAEVGAVRLVANWKLIEPRDDAWNFGSLDAYIGKLAAAGIRPFPVLFHTAPFVNSNDLRLPVHSRRQKEQWKEFVAMVVQRYGADGDYWSTEYPARHPGQQPMPVTTWQVWNRGERPQARARSEPRPVRRAGQDLRRGGCEPRRGGRCRARRHVRKAPRRRRDQGEQVPQADVQVNRRQGGLRRRRGPSLLPRHQGDQAADHGDPQGAEAKKDKGTDIWLTELGWGSSKNGRLGVGKKKQSKLLKQSFTLILKKRRKWKVGGVMWYSWRDLPKRQAPCEWCASAGLLKGNGTNAKPALKKFVRFTGGS